MTKLFAPLVRNQTPVTGSIVNTGGGSAAGSYQSFARHGYSGNEIVYACIELLASSAGEPHIAGRRWRRNKATIRAENGQLHEFEVNAETVRNIESERMSKGQTRAQVRNFLVRNGYVEQLPSHPLVTLLNAPNPFMSRGQLWGTIVMDKCLAGNAFLLKGRYQGGPLNGKVAELWRLRPDRVKVNPDPRVAGKAASYEYGTGPNAVTFPPEDVIHFRNRNPLDDYLGMPKLMAIAGRVDIDNYMRSFLKTFFERGGTGPGAVLSIKQRLTPEAKDSIRDKFKRQFGGNSGFHELLVLDQADTSYQRMGLDRGLRDALPKDIDAMNEARIAMAFGIPGSIVGLLIGYESSSYANKRQDWEVLWDLTMTPMLSEMDDVLNLTLVPEFGQIDEVYFDLSDIKALQEDVDKRQARALKAFQSGVAAFEETRDEIGLNPNDPEGWFMFPEYLVARRYKDLDKKPLAEIEEGAGGGNPEEPEGARPAKNYVAGERWRNGEPLIVEEPRCPKCERRVGANVNVGASLSCPRCRENFIVSQNGALTGERA
jgi:HK97 family phage portal protein